MRHWMRRAAWTFVFAASAASAQAQADAAERRDVIGTGDAIRVRLFHADLRETQLALEAELPVDERGEVVLPRLGRRAVAGYSIEELRERVTAELEDAFPASVVEVSVLRRVIVHGAVRRPGSVLLASYQATVGDALAAAEGILPQGRTNLVRVLRGDRVLQVRLGDTERVAGLTLQSGDEVVVPERPWLVREPALSAALLSSAVTLLVTLIIVAQ
jgi:protein involved in polysaccharide export with SLBB domain